MKVRSGRSLRVSTAFKEGQESRLPNAPTVLGLLQLSEYVPVRASGFRSLGMCLINLMHSLVKSQSLTQNFCQDQGLALCNQSGHYSSFFIKFLSAPFSWAGLSFLYSLSRIGLTFKNFILLQVGYLDSGSVLGLICPSDSYFKFITTRSIS